MGASGIFQAFDVIEFLFQSQVQSQFTVIAKNTAFIIVTLLQVHLITMQAPLIAFAWVKLAEFSLGAMGLTIAYRIQGYSIKLWCWSFSVARNLLRESWPLILSGVTIVIYMKIDQIMLGKMSGDLAVGFYSAAARISEAWYFIPTAINSSLSPSIFAAKKVSEDIYYRRIEQLLRILLLVSIVIALPMSFFSKSIITFLFGNSYAVSGSILAIHIWASLFVFMGFGTSSWFIAENLTGLAFRRNVVGAIINVLLNLILIPNYAGIGAAISTLISYAVALYLLKNKRYVMTLLVIIHNRF